MISRRGFLAATGLALAAGSAFAAPAPDPLATLKGAAAKNGIRFGSDSDVPIITAPPPYRDLFLAQCDLLAPNLAWKLTQPMRDGADPAGEEANVRFALDHGLDLTGAHFLWYIGLPPWFAQIGDPIRAQSAALSHIHALGERYRGKVFSWNVANEVIKAGSDRPDGLRPTPLLAALGPDYFDLAFRAARRADPAAFLVLNEDDLEMARSGNEQKRTTLLRLLDRFAEDETPIDAIGIQSHLALADPFDAKRFRAFLAELASRKLKIILTELDVLDVGAPTDHAARDRAVADLYKQYLETALDETAVMAVVTWGLSDRYTWLTPASSPKYARADNEPGRPLPFDADFAPKPAFEAIRTAFAHAPPRTMVKRRTAS